MLKYLTGFLAIAMLACNGKNEKASIPDAPHTQGDSNAGRTSNTPDSGVSKPVQANGNNAHKNTTAPVTDMQRFCNNEWVAYCFDLPLKEYKKDDEAPDIKAKHVFKHKTKKENDITVQGIIRSNTETPLENYYAGYYDEERDAGKVVETRALFMDKKCFYLQGYWNNMIAKYRYIEVVWVRPEEVVTYTANFNVADTSLWNGRLKKLLEGDIELK
jgi:hypothetical protein